MDSDKVFCALCKEHVVVKLDVDDDEPHEADAASLLSGSPSSTEDREEYERAAEIYTALVRRYEKMIVDAHLSSCAWRRRGCDPSIQRIEGLLNVQTAITSVQARHQSLDLPGDDIPPVSPLPATTHPSESILERFRFDETGDINANSLRLAVCGWQQQSQDVVECRHCFRSLGLWLYRGDSPTMERLDALESHLEYCPWISREAQDTEIELPTSSGTTPELAKPEKTKLAGWELIIHAMEKDNSRHGRRAKPVRAAQDGALNTTTGGMDGGPDEPETSEQRERKVKELLRRIKEIKRPFNVKGLLKRSKDKVKT